MIVFYKLSHLVEHIASFSDDAVHNSIEQAVGAENRKFISILKTIHSVLVKSQEKLKNKMSKQARVVEYSIKNEMKRLKKKLRGNMNKTCNKVDCKLRQNKLRMTNSRMLLNSSPIRQNNI